MPQHPGDLLWLLPNPPCGLPSPPWEAPPTAGGPLPGLGPHSPNALGEQRSEASVSRCRFVKKDPEGERRDPGRLLSPNLASPAPPPGVVVPLGAPGKPGEGALSKGLCLPHWGPNFKTQSLNVHFLQRARSQPGLRTRVHCSGPVPGVALVPSGQ